VPARARGQGLLGRGEGVGHARPDSRGTSSSSHCSRKSTGPVTGLPPRRAGGRHAVGVELLLLSGSTRLGSTNTAVLRTVRDLVPDSVTAVLYEGLADLPAFNPDDDRDPLPPPVTDLRAHLAAADAVLVCTPEYAGGLPGAFKNLLDWTVGGTELAGMPVAWVNVASAAAPTGGAGAHAAVATVLGYVGATVVAAACLRLPLTRAAVAADATIHDPDIRDQLSRAIDLLLHR